MLTKPQDGSAELDRQPPAVGLLLCLDRHLHLHTPAHLPTCPHCTCCWPGPEGWAVWWPLHSSTGLLHRQAGAHSHSPRHWALQQG